MSLILYGFASHKCWAILRCNYVYVSDGDILHYPLLLQDDKKIKFEKVASLQTQDDKLTQMCMALAPSAATSWCRVSMVIIVSHHGAPVLEFHLTVS